MCVVQCIRVVIVYMDVCVRTLSCVNASVNVVHVCYTYLILFVFGRVAYQAYVHISARLFIAAASLLRACIHVGCSNMNIAKIVYGMVSYSIV